MIKKLLSFRILILLMIFPACTGTKLTNPNVEKGGIIIQPGDKLTVDLQDIVALNIQNYTVSLKSITPDFATATPLYDLTDFANTQMAASSVPAFQFVMPKSVTAAKPFLIVVDFPAQSTQLIDIVFDNQLYVR